MPGFYHPDDFRVGSFTKFVFPMIRSAFPTTIARELINVKPIEAPSAKVLYPQYQKPKTPKLTQKQMIKQMLQNMQGWLKSL